MLISELFQYGSSELRKAGIDEPELEASLILCSTLGLSRTTLYLSLTHRISSKHHQQFLKYLGQRLQRIPLAYIFGEQEFWSLGFHVGPETLIPRPETEVLVENVLRVCAPQQAHTLRIIDFGTGSGVLAIVLAKEMPGSMVVAVDRSVEALRIARKNCNRHGVETRVTCLASDWGSALGTERYDIIVSNPPYIASAVLSKLQPEVLQEPMGALDGGDEGMEAIANLLVDVQRLLRSGGFFFMEIGYDQETLAREILQKKGCFSSIVVHKDLAGLPRVVQAVKN